MARKKGKPVSFDAMVKFFIRQYGIPTKRDVDRLIEKLDRIEALVKTSGGAVSRKAARKGRGKSTVTASDTVFNAIKSFRQGAGFSDIQTKTGFDEKKLRNIIFRLNKLNKIKRKSRGIYIIA
jgi:hypothetical protein